MDALSSCIKEHEQRHNKLMINMVVLEKIWDIFKPPYIRTTSLYLASLIGLIVGIRYK